MKRKKSSFSRAGLATGATVVYLLLGGTDVNADSYNVLLTANGVNPTYIQAKNQSGAKEPGKGPDSKDSTFSKDPANSAIDFFLQNSDGDFTVDAREPNSTSDFYARIEGRGIPGTIDANLASQISEPEGNFDWKNIVIELYNSGNISNPSNRIGIYDGHDWANGSVSLPTLTIQNGLCYQLLIRPRHMADLDFNQRIGFGDFSVVGLYWFNQDASSSNRWNKLSDIDRSGATDFNDLSHITGIAGDWLWVQDPNLISKLISTFQSQYLEQLLNPLIQNLYNNKTQQGRVFCLINSKPNPQAYRFRGGVIKEIAQNNRYQSKNKPSLKQILALSNNNHNEDLSRQYETIDHKLTTNNHRVFISSMHLSAICDRAPPAS